MEEGNRQGRGEREGRGRCYLDEYHRPTLPSPGPCPQYPHGLPFRAPRHFRANLEVCISAALTCTCPGEARGNSRTGPFRKQSECQLAGLLSAQLMALAGPVRSCPCFPPHPYPTGAAPCSHTQKHWSSMAVICKASRREGWEEQVAPVTAADSLTQFLGYDRH